MVDSSPICVTGPFLIGATCGQALLDITFNQTPFGPSGGLEFIENKQNYVNVYSKTYTDAFTDYAGYSPHEFSWLQGDATIYRPGLLARDLWKWDISGESDYGIIEPPINEPNYDLFDSNWSAQFLVYVRGDELDFSCHSLGLGCSHRLGTVARGVTFDIHENCPSQYLKPDRVYAWDTKTGKRLADYHGPDLGITANDEPTYLDIFQEFRKIKEEEYVKKYLGSSYLGCVYDDINSISSAKCPEQGRYFAKYLEYCRTSATFWDTPLDTPLQRQAQMGQLKSESIEIKISGQIEKEIKLGSIINIKNHNTMPNHEPRRNSGEWLVTSISYEFQSDSTFSMILILMRDTLGYYKSGIMVWDSPLYITENKWNG